MRLDPVSFSSARPWMMPVSASCQGSGVQIVRSSDAGGGSSQGAGAASRPQLPGSCRVRKSVELDQASDQEALTALLASLQGLYLDGDLLTTFYKEAEAVRTGGTLAMWLLPAMAHLTALSLHSLVYPGQPHCATALATVVVHGYLATAAVSISRKCAHFSCGSGGLS